MNEGKQSRIEKNAARERDEMEPLNDQYLAQIAVL